MERYKKFHPLFRRLLMSLVLLPGFVALPYSGKHDAKSGKTKSFVDYRRPHVETPTF